MLSQPENENKHGSFGTNQRMRNLIPSTVGVYEKAKEI